MPRDPKFVCDECGHDFNLGDNEYGFHICPQCHTRYKLHAETGWNKQELPRSSGKVDVKSGKTKLKVNWPTLDGVDLGAFAPIKEAPGSEAGLVCSFCQKPIDLAHATFGTSKPRKIRSERITKDVATGVVEIEEKVIHVTDQLVACPDCCNEIKPIMQNCSICKGKKELRYLALEGAPILPCKFCKGTGKEMVKASGNKWPEFD